MSSTSKAAAASAVSWTRMPRSTAVPVWSPPPSTAEVGLLPSVTNGSPHSGAPRQDSVPAARAGAVWLTVAWGYPELAGDVALLTSELTTNAVLHGSLRDRHLRVGLHLSGSVLRIEVTDPKSERRPEPRAVVADDEQYGRGLQIVSALSARWGASDRVVGKTVGAELALKPPPV